MALSQLFQTKSLDALIAQTTEGKHQLKRTLGPLNLIALGIGAIIGAGIFATIGTAAAGDAQRPGAGPALMLSFVLTAAVCALTALCYAEFAAMVPSRAPPTRMRTPPWASSWPGSSAGT